MTRIALIAALVAAAVTGFVAHKARGASKDPRAAEQMTVSEVERRLESDDYHEALRELGADVVPVLVRLYSDAGSDPERRTRIANALYSFGWRSEAARVALERDLSTDHERLRLAVQWALGRVSGDDRVVARLLSILRHDPNALFSEKAACALAHDQIHLDERQKLALYGGLVETLRSYDARVRRDAIRALEIHTGQKRGFRAWDDDAAREDAVAEWERWLDDYQAAL